MINDIALTLRSQKGLPLTASEVDNNFAHLRSGILDLATVAGKWVVIGTEPPAGERDNVLWIPSDFRGIYAWDSVNSKWVMMLDPKLYAVATNAGNAYSITIPGEYAAMSDLTGRIIVVKVQQDNTDKATLAVNSFSATAIKKLATTDTAAGDIKSGSLCVFIYDGTNFILLNPAPVTLPPIPKLFTSDLIDIPDYLTPVKITHGFKKHPEFLRAVLVVTSETDAGWGLNEEVDARSFIADISDSDVDAPLFTITSLVESDVYKFQICTQKCDNHAQFVGKNGVSADISLANLRARYKFKLYAMAYPE